MRDIISIRQQLLVRNVMNNAQFAMEVVHIIVLYALKGIFCRITNVGLVVMELFIKTQRIELALFVLNATKPAHYVNTHP